MDPGLIGMLVINLFPLRVDLSPVPRIVYQWGKSKFELCDLFLKKMLLCIIQSLDSIHMMTDNGVAFNES